MSGLCVLRGLVRNRFAARTFGVALIGGIAIRAAAVGVLGGRPATQAESLTLHAPRVVVLKSQRVLHLFDGDRLVRSYPVDLGVSPNGPKLRMGDGRTPVGTYRIVARNAESPYHRFLGIDYPNGAAIEQGLKWGLISPGEAAEIRRSLDSGARPDWRTKLGGGIGIHGCRTGRDWTAGCIALGDSDMDELFGVLRIGDPVEILP